MTLLQAAVTFSADSRHKRSRTALLILTLAVTALALAAAYLAEWFSLPLSHFYRYLCVVPVALTAYYFGLVPGALTAIFCCSAYLSELFFLLAVPGTSAQRVELLSFVLFLNLLAYVVADTATSLRTHQRLSRAIKAWGELTANATALHEVTALILSEAEQICGAEKVLLLLRNPLDAHWELISRAGTQPVELMAGDGEEGNDLLHWLLSQDTPVSFRGLDQNPGPLLDVSCQLQAVTAQPLRDTRGGLMGLLVLINPEDDDVLAENQASVDDLVERSAKALEQAGLYARTDDALAHRVRELGAIQLTARKLNASFDPQQILRLTLTCALEITEANAGVVLSVIDDLPGSCISQGAQASEDHMRHLQALTTLLDSPTLSAGADSVHHRLLPDACLQLFVPIRREHEPVGIIALESLAPNSFSEAAQRAVASLADHAATALENARLFAEIQREQQRANLIIHSVADGLFTVDEHTCIQTFNPSAERLTGWQAEQAVGRSCCDVLACEHGRDGTNGLCPIQRAIAGQQVAYDEHLVIQERLGSKRVISMSVSPLARTGRYSEGFAVLFHDITKQDEMDRLQREFIAAFSHELRAPLTRISAIAEMLAQDETPGGRLLDRHQRLNFLLAQTRHLADFADRVLDVFKLDSGLQPLQLMPVPALLIAQQALADWQAADGQHEFKITSPEHLPLVWADESGLQRVLSNLLDNAIKYSPAGTRVEINLAINSTGGVEIAVIDQGPGIAAEHQSRVFDRFYRVDGSDAQRVYGHGLGLYIARTLVQKMGGQIWVESEPGKGCRFAFTLPSTEEADDGRLYPGS